MEPGSENSWWEAGLPADQWDSGSGPSSQPLSLWLEKALRADHITPHPLPTPLLVPSGCTVFRSKARKSSVPVVKACSVSQNRNLGTLRLCTAEAWSLVLILAQGDLGKSFSSSWLGLLIQKTRGLQ